MNESISVIQKHARKVAPTIDHRYRLNNRVIVWKPIRQDYTPWFSIHHEKTNISNLPMFRSDDLFCTAVTSVVTSSIRTPDISLLCPLQFMTSVRNPRCRYFQNSLEIAAINLEVVSSVIFSLFLTLELVQT